MGSFDSYRGLGSAGFLRGNVGLVVIPVVDPHQTLNG